MTGAAGEPVVLVTLPISGPRDAFVLRRHGQMSCRALSLEGPEQIRFVTILSEAARSLLGATGLTAALAVVPGAPAMLTVTFVWEGRERPAADLVAAARRLLHHVVYADSPTPVLVLGQLLPRHDGASDARIARARDELAALRAVDMSEELQHQNRDLLAALQEARARQEESERLNAELEETNRGVMALYSELSKELEDTNSGVVALYAELEDKTRRLRLADEEKTRFWANVSHELRSPVNAVIALTRLLLAPDAEPLTEEQRQQVSLVLSSGTTLLALVEELLDTAKAESGRLEAQLSTVDLRTLLHQLRGTLGGMAKDGVRFTVPDTDLVDPATGTARPLVTDEVMLTRVLRNVLSNGLKFTDTGEVRLDVTHEVRDGTPWAVFVVTDTGIGIPEDQQNRVFEEFYQVRGPHQRGRSGTGLGLPYARKLTELLGGRLTLSSEPDHGTRVSVELPAGPGDQLPRATGPAADGPRTPRFGHVMIVDDDPAFVASLRPALDTLAGRVTEISDSSEALRAMRQRRPDGVLLDLFMPAPDGYRLLEAIAADPDLAPIPVVVLTSASHGDIDRSRLGTARAVLGKTHLTTDSLAAALGPRPGTRPAAPGGTTVAHPAAHPAAHLAESDGSDA
ncbi:hybrid sensor histidine kinase/response regulator [Streptomyces sp. NPDC026672]|uniref:hybrid sensor histidine kinase/response regulator n=1 Tax=unclassified Streptomyces TaxID=2593676 RepID=UPI0033EF1752